MGARRVLVFDDEEDILYLCKLILQSRGFDVATRNHCANAVNDVKEFRPDIVIMDNLIPETGGVAATQAIKAVFPNTPVILLTASRNIEKLAKDGNFEAFLEKPFDVHELVALIDASTVAS